MVKYILTLAAALCFSMSYAQDAAPVADKAVDAAKEAVVKTDKVGNTTKSAEPKKKNLWQSLAKITFRKEYDELMGFKIDKPVFSESVKSLAGTEVEVKGYIIPVEGYKSHTEFIFSAFPYNMCFFCGGAGPETVMEVETKEPVKYSAEQIVLRGKLALNADDINRLMYLLTDATLVKE